MFANTNLPEPIVGQARSIETQRRIIQSAAKVFANKGFKGTSIRAIAEEAGANHSTINYHFGTKKDLWVTVVTHLFHSFQSVGQSFEFDEEGDIEAQFHDQVYQIVDYLAHHPQLFRIILREAIDEDSLIELIKPQIQEFTKFTRDWYKIVQRLGICSDIPLGDFHSIFQSAVVTRFIYGIETTMITGLQPTDPIIIKSHVDSIVKIFLGRTA